MVTICVCTCNHWHNSSKHTLVYITVSQGAKVVVLDINGMLYLNVLLCFHVYSYKCGDVLLTW